MTEEMELIQVPCAICGAPMMLEVPLEPIARGYAMKLSKGVVHAGCAKNVDAAATQREKAGRSIALRESWEKICPREFQKPINWRECGNGLRKQYDQIMAWQFGPRGLISFGKTSRCKTRFTFALCQREHLAGRSVAFVRHPEFRDVVSRLSFEDARALHAYIKPLQKADILFFDDLGKGRITEATEEAIESLIDLRTRSERPIFFTTNEGDESLQARLSEDRGEPMVRRIFDFCEPIDFGFA